MKNIVCIFSDDFRKELGGKHSLIGIYGNTLNIHSTKQILPQLSITTYIHADISDMEDVNRFVINVKLNGDTISENNVPETVIKAFLSKAKENENNLFSGVYNCNLALVPVPKENNTIEAEVMINNQVVYTQKLEVNVNAS